MRARREDGRLTAALAALGTVCVLGAVASILAPFAGGSTIGGAALAAAMFAGCAVAAERMAPRSAVVARDAVSATVSDVCGAGASYFLGFAAGVAAASAGGGVSASFLVAGLAALPYAAVVQWRRPGIWVQLATSAAVVDIGLAAMGLRAGAGPQHSAAVLVAAGVLLATGGQSGWLRPASVTSATSALAVLAGAAWLLGDDASGWDVGVALLLVAVIAVAAVASASASLVAALAAGAPVVVLLGLLRSGHGWWSPPLAMALTGAGCALLAAYVYRADDAAHLGGVFTWCCTLVVVGDLFLASSSRPRGVLAVVAAAVLFVAAAAARRRPATVLAGITLVTALPRLVSGAASGRLTLLALGALLLYVATSVARRTPRT